VRPAPGYHPAVFSDTLLALERAHAFRLLVWGAASVLAGTALFSLLALRRAGSPLLQGFAIQIVAWGAVALVVGGIWRGTLRERDGAAAVLLDRMLWLATGLHVGYALTGAALAVAGWMMGRRLAVVGAGIGLLVQGLALLVLHLLLLASVSPLV
jgi:hypothetical protein